MSTPEQIIKACANGNAFAASFLTHFWHFAHAIDDVVDKPSEIDDESVTRSVINLIADVGQNPFVEQHRSSIITLIQLCAAAWLDSNKMAQSGVAEERIASDVLKGMYHEVFWFTALKTGGWNHMRNTQKEFREFDFEPKGGS